MTENLLENNIIEKNILTELNINIDHIATIRNARGGVEPDPILGALECIQAGADGIVCHLREDRRHIKDNDVIRLRELNTRLDLEMATSKDVIDLAFKVKPDLVTIVPEKREELTTEGGLNTQFKQNELKELTKRFKDLGIIVSLFIEPEKEKINDTLEIGADMVEFHTGHYSNDYPNNLGSHLSKIKEAILYAKINNLRIAAGHGLNYQNTESIASIKGIDELSIGHSIISRAVFVGLHNAVKEMKEIIKNANN